MTDAVYTTDNQPRVAHGGNIHRPTAITKTLRPTTPLRITLASIGLTILTITGIIVTRQAIAMTIHTTPTQYHATYYTAGHLDQALAIILAITGAAFLFTGIFPYHPGPLIGNLFMSISSAGYAGPILLLILTAIAGLPNTANSPDSWLQNHGIQTHSIPHTGTGSITTTRHGTPVTIAYNNTQTTINLTIQPA